MTPSDGHRRRARARWAATTAAVTLVLLSMLLLRARQWNPALSYDTETFYYTALAQDRPQWNLAAALSSYLTRPFTNGDEPRTDQAKPLFVSILRLWHGAVSVLRHGALPFPNHKTYSDFITCSYVLAFLFCCALGARAKLPFVTLAAATLTFFSPWMISASYFNSYTALSLVPLVLSVFLLVAPSPAPFWAGALCGLDAQINQSTLAFVPGMVILLASRPIRARVFAAGALRFAAGIGIVVLASDAAIATVDAATGLDYLPQSVVLLSYLRRSFAESREFFDVYRGLTGASLFPRMVWEHSAVLSVSAVLLLLAAVLGRRRGGIAVDRAALCLALFLLSALLVIDLRDGPKFSRSYVLLLPFLNLLVVAGFLRTITGRTGDARAALAVLAGVVAAASGIEIAVSLWRLDEAAIGVRRLFERRDAGDAPLFVARADGFRPVFQLMVEDLPREGRRLEEFDDVCALAGARGTDDGVLVVVGPGVPSVLVEAPAVDLPLPALSQSHGPPTGTCGGGLRWRAELVETRPFFAHYPFLVWEDPEQTYQMLIARLYSARAYREPIGAVTVWRVKTSPSVSELAAD
jgi:hypothetical protein